MKKTHITIRANDLESFLSQLDSSLHSEGLENLSRKFNVEITEREIKNLNEENLRDLFAKLHVLPDAELKEALKNCPEIRELWYEHFVRWAFGQEADPF
jgi:hypothetical protein